MTTAGSAPPFYRRRWFKLLISLMVLGSLFSQLNIPELGAFIERADWRYLALLLVLLPLDRVFMAWKWRLLLRTEYPEYGLLEAIKVYLLSNAAGLALPLGGMGSDVVRLGLLKFQGIPSELSVSSILVERLTGLAGSLLMLILGLLLLLSLLTQPSSVPLQSLLILACVGTTIGLALILSPRLRSLLGADRWMLALFTRLRLGRHWQATLRLANRQRLIGWSIFLSWLEQFAMIGSFYLCCRAFQVDLGFLESMAIMPVAAILERLPLSLWGLGVREAGVIYMAGLFGVSYADALLASLANFLIFMVAMIPVVIWFLIGRWRVAQDARTCS